MNKFNLFILVVAAVVATSMFAVPAMAQDANPVIAVDATARAQISLLDARIIKLNTAVAYYNGIYTAAANKAVKAAAAEMNYLKRVKNDLEALKRDAVTNDGLEKILAAKNYLTAEEIKNVMDGKSTTEAGKALEPCITALSRKASLALIQEAEKVDLTKPEDSKPDAVATRTSFDAMTDNRTKAVREKVGTLDIQINGTAEDNKNSVVTKLTAAENNVLAVKSRTDILWPAGIILAVLIIVLFLFVGIKTAKPRKTKD